MKFIWLLFPLSTTAFTCIPSIVKDIRRSSSLLSQDKPHEDIVPQFTNYNALKALNTAKRLSTYSIIGMLSAFPAILSSPSGALANTLEDANNKLANYGLPPILFVPPGLVPLVSEYGRGNSRAKITNPVLVQFCRPSLWVVASTTVNNNGEAGTISANDYLKGDSAFFYTSPLDGKPAPTTKEAISSFILKSLSQKGDPVESFQLLGLRTDTDNVRGKTYYLADIRYTLNTEAGFLVDRRGVASVTSVGSYAQALVAVTTTKRFKDLEGKLRDVAGSFRVYPLNSGIFSVTEDVSPISPSPE